MPFSKETAAAILLINEKRKQAQILAPLDWRERVPLLYGNYFWHPFSQPHIELWDWANAITPDNHPEPFCAFWSRGRGKSTNTEAITADLGVMRRRNYGMYVSGTQDQADKHVATIAAMLEREAVQRVNAEVSQPRVGKNGSRSWNRKIVTTASGFTIEAVGLNKAVRGQKIDWARPDWIVFDDVDEKHDTEETIRKKIELITQSILPAGSPNAAILFVQNLIDINSIATALSIPAGQSRGDILGADFLMGRRISGPFPAVDGLEYDVVQDGEKNRFRITGGVSLWNGFDLNVCEVEINRVGPTAYLLEYQHEVDTDNPNSLLTAEDFERSRLRSVPVDLARVAVAVDPPASSGTCGIVAGGKGIVDGEWHGFTLEDATTPAGVKPEEWALAVLKCYYRTRADVIICEVNNGGDMVESTIRNTRWLDDKGNAILDGRQVHIEQVRASRGKTTRAEPVAVVFQQGRGHHVGTFSELEKQWRQYQPGDESPDRLDAEVWLYTGLDLIEGDVTITVSRYA